MKKENKKHWNAKCRVIPFCRKTAALMMALFVSGMLSVYAQTASTKVNVSAQSTPLQQVLQEMEKQSGYFKFNYSSTDVAGKSVTANISGMTVQQALPTVLKGLSLRYSVKGKFIQIFKAPTSTKGVVIDETSGLPIIGAAVMVKGTSVGAATDLEGKFEINKIPEGGETLIVSFVGYTTKEITIQPTLKISLHESISSLEEAVVVGYGSLTRKDLTGSVASVRMDEVMNLPAVSVDDAMMGKIAGVNVTKADGTPGGAVRFRIRGGASLSGSADPLYVIDGIPTEINNNYMGSTVTEIVNALEAANYGEDFNNSISGNFTRGLNSLAGLNINDIESISVLKDASATAIYGSKAANGVVIITTKKGMHDQKPTISLNYNMTISNPIKEKLLNGQQYIDALSESMRTSIANMQANLERHPEMATRLQSYINSTQKRLEELPTFGNADSDWLGAVLQMGVSHNADLSIQGGSNRSRYYSSLAVAQNDGTVINTNFRRLSGKSSLDADINNRIHFNTNVMYSYTKNNLSAGAYTQAMSAPPILPMYKEDGSYSDYTSIGGVGASYMGFQNPLAVASVTNRSRSYGIKGSLGVTVDILDNLKFKSVYSIDWSNYNQLNYTPSYVMVGGYYGVQDSEGGMGSQSQSTSTNTFWENTLSYNNVWADGKHRLDAVLGHSWEENRASFFSAAGKGYPDDVFLNSLSSAATPTSVAGANPSSSACLLSFYARLNYVLLNKYLFTFTGRSDTSSKFAKSHRTGFFPSGAIAWRINEESFLKDAEWIDELKLRASMGKVGTSHIAPYQFLTLFAPGDYGGKNALYPYQLGNDDIRWEETTQKDLGLDFSFLKGKVTGTLAYYTKKTTGALLTVSAAPSTGFSTYTTNIASIRNHGPEFEVMAELFRNKDWRWMISANIASNKSKVLHINGDYSDASDRHALNMGTSLVREGEPLGNLCGHKTLGLIDTEEQLLEYQERFSMWSNMMPDMGIGSYILDLDETGYYYEDKIGNCTPDFFGGFSSTLSWKNFTLMAGFTFSVGNDLIYQKDVNDCSFSSTGNRSTRVLKASSHDKYTGKPLSTFNTTYFLTDLNVYDASYLKLQSLTISYNLPNAFAKKLGLQNASIYCTGGNLFTITKYPGPDPAVSDDPYSITGGGRDVSSYPTVKSVTFGARVSF